MKIIIRFLLWHSLDFLLPFLLEVKASFIENQVYRLLTLSRFRKDRSITILVTNDTKKLIKIFTRGGLAKESLVNQNMAEVL